MEPERGIATLIVVLFLLISPSAASLSYFYITKNPSLRPLGITKASLLAFSGGATYAGVLASVEWDSRRSGKVTQEDMHRALSNAFRAKGVEVYVVFTEGQSGTHIQYMVGKSVFGPFPQSRAAEGISLAVDAYRMKFPVMN